LSNNGNNQWGGVSEPTRAQLAAFADDGGGLGGLVDVFDVEAEGFFGAHRGVEQEPPQGFVTRRKVASAPQPFELIGGDDPQVGVAAFVAAADPGGRVCARPALPGAVGEEAAEGGEVEVPGGRRGVPVVGVSRNPRRVRGWSRLTGWCPARSTRRCRQKP